MENARIPFVANPGVRSVSGFCCIPHENYTRFAWSVNHSACGSTRYPSVADPWATLVITIMGCPHNGPMLSAEWCHLPI